MSWLLTYVHSGHTITEPDAVKGENERTYHGYKSGSMPRPHHLMIFYLVD
jgi:hypothetical protein